MTRWELPAEPEWPGPVFAVRTDQGTTWTRDDRYPGEWVSLAQPGSMGGCRMQWRELIMFGLTDVTSEFEE
jgi:hypothetical protein